MRHCDCADSLIEALTGGDGEVRPVAGAAPTTSCLWCGERAAEPEPVDAPGSR